MFIQVEISHEKVCHVPSTDLPICVFKLSYKKALEKWWWRPAALLIAACFKPTIMVIWINTTVKIYCGLH